MTNPFALVGDLPALPSPPLPAFMSGPLASRPVASAAHLGWLYYDETGRGTYACIYDSGGFSWVLVGGWVTPPATETSSGTAGQRAVDASYFYACVATDTWKRVPFDLASW